MMMVLTVYTMVSCIEYMMISFSIYTRVAVIAYIYIMLALTGCCTLCILLWPKPCKQWRLV